MYLSGGIGTASLTLSQAGLAYGLTATALTGATTNTHFHEAPPGVVGGVGVVATLIRSVSDELPDASGLARWMVDASRARWCL